MQDVTKVILLQDSRYMIWIYLTSSVSEEFSFEENLHVDNYIARKNKLQT